MTRTLVFAVAMSALALGLAACGRQGDLERPGPMWGAKAKADYAAAQKHKQAEQKTDQSNQIEPLPDEGDAPANSATP